MKEQLLRKFLRYVSVTSQSNAANKVVPSSRGQRELARLLMKELEALGFQDIEISEHSVVTAHLPSNLPEGKKVATVGWVAHLDTVDVNLNARIHPQVIRNYQGGDICLNKELDRWIRVAEHPEVEDYIGDDLVVTDGTSVLGADNKSAIANVMTAMETIVRENRPHGTIYVCFVPDEEIGLLGAKEIDFSKFPVDYAYTIDCCALGEVVYETFNAGSATLKVQGVTAHPMSSKGVLVNPILVAHDFIATLDRTQTPECTEGTEGFIWVNGIQGNASSATVSLKLRDHNLAGYKAKKAYLEQSARLLRARHPRAKIELTMSDVYGNIHDAVTERNKACIDQLYRALRQLRIEPKTIAMRGGTDGSFISTKGILTPNYFTGALNFHSYCEFQPLGAMEKSTQVTLKLVDLIANAK